jgi:hypothetical protein
VAVTREQSEKKEREERERGGRNYELIQVKANRVRLVGATESRRLL